VTSEFSVDALRCISAVVIVPRNGYANRLQAWASASALADSIGASTRVFWEPEGVAAADPFDLFDAPWFESLSISKEDLNDLVGGDHDSVPRYLTHDVVRSVMYLAGHDLGEQAFIPELIKLGKSLSTPHTLVIIAGGKFHTVDASHARAARQEFYQSLRWNAAINEVVEPLTLRHGPYVALHIRTTDRSIEAPGRTSIRRALEQVRGASAGRSLFVCADTAHSRRTWSKEAQRLGFDTWTVEEVEYDRSIPANGVSAMVDWLLLADAEMVIHPRDSTFSSEAAVAGGTWRVSVPLTAAPWLRSSRQVQRFLRDAAAFPRRRFQGIT